MYIYTGCVCNIQVDRRINLTGQIARAYGDQDASLMTITEIASGSVKFSWTNNSLRTEPTTDTCPQQQINEVNFRTDNIENFLTA